MKVLRLEFTASRLRVGVGNAANDEYFVGAGSTGAGGAKS